MSSRNVRNGSTRTACPISLAVFSARAGISGNTLHIADNRQKVNRALAHTEFEQLGALNCEPASYAAVF